MKIDSTDNYSGTDNLEVMAAAKNYNAFLAKLVCASLPDGSMAVDFGAGIGLFSSAVSRNGIDVACVEPDALHQEILSQKGFTVYSSSAELADQSYDYIYTLNVLEHIERDDQALLDLFRIMRPGGKILIYLPAMQVLFSAMDDKVGHHRRYSKKQLASLVKNVGLRPLRCEYVDSLGFFVTLLYKVIGNKDGSINQRALVFYDRILFPLSRFMDRLFKPWFGKNIYMIAERP